MEFRNNPFAVKTPESLSAAEIVELFVPYPEFENLQETGHQFLHGHRGSGKSMMLRMMEPECQALHRKCTVEDLPYVGSYLSIKATEINQPEFERLETEPSGFVLSEHVLATKVLSHLLTTVARFLSARACKEGLEDQLRAFIERDFMRRLELCGWDTSVGEGLREARTIDALFQFASDIIDRLQANTIRYVKGRAFVATPQPYKGALLGFQDVLLPVVRGLQEKGLLPSCPVFLLLDDADNLTEQQTKILNTWVSYRSTEVISLKISTQLGYKTLLTSGGASIEAPHDFSEIHFTTVRTGSVRAGYRELVADIVRRRLIKYGVPDVSPEDLFPEDEKQARAIKEIEEELKKAWHEKETGGYRPGDDAYRLARPEYIRRLGGASKQGATYRYAGFEQLVHVSSGIIRYFLDPAAKMFADQLKRIGGEKVRQIAPDIQDVHIRKQSDDLLLGSFENMRNEVRHGGPNSAVEIDQLKNLISGIGYLFQASLLDETASQRRVFSFLISDDAPEHLREVLNLGVRCGYLYKDSIGRKEGTGRTVLYVLTRRLAPAFKLDPIGFSSYLSVTSDYLCGLMQNPRSYTSRLKKMNVQQTSIQLQLELPEGSSQ